MVVRNNYKYIANIHNYSRFFSYITPILLIISVFLSIINKAYIDKLYNDFTSTVYFVFVMLICRNLDKIKEDSKNKIDFSELFTIFLEYHCAHWLVMKDSNGFIFNLFCFFIAILIYLFFLFSKKISYSMNTILFYFMTLIQLFLSYISGASTEIIVILAIPTILLQCYLAFRGFKNR